MPPDGKTNGLDDRVFAFDADDNLCRQETFCSYIFYRFVKSVIMTLRLRDPHIKGRLIYGKNCDYFEGRAGLSER